MIVLQWALLVAAAGISDHYHKLPILVIDTEGSSDPYHACRNSIAWSFGDIPLLSTIEISRLIIVGRGDCGGRFERTPHDRGATTADDSTLLVSKVGHLPTTMQWYPIGIMSQY